ncbi:hypothetical protein ACIQCJ_02610 [Streptomyces sp. NPDC093221]|uniref:hypothetical protein n=1 Tax=Streptomyces sp. NPDC093221 TaxID=3366032 RepID=UPI0037FA1850
MTKEGRLYEYVGPPELKARVVSGDEGQRIRTSEDLSRWLSTQGLEESAEPFTFVVGVDGLLRLAPRRSEHVSCSGAQPVLSAGEMTFAQTLGEWVVTEISNQSTGYCPDLASWRAVTAALIRIGVAHPDGFTHGVVFRRCPGCGQVNIVREEDFVCVFCESILPQHWNVDGDGID